MQNRSTQSIRNPAMDYSYNGSILRDILFYASWFCCFDGNHISRSCNAVAHELAHRGSSRHNNIWIEDPLDGLLSLLFADLQN